MSGEEKMYFDVLTIFPDLFPGPLAESITGRALEEDIIEVNSVDIREYALDKHAKVDDYPYGGGAGMVMKPEPIYRAHRAVSTCRGEVPETILLSPQGQTFDQDTALELSQLSGLIMICGHYEGVDERVREQLVDRELSLGDYVLTGGELPAMIIIDAISRMIPGVVGESESTRRDSFYNGLLDYPQYTRPRDFKGRKVPEVLLSGHHARIETWRKKRSLKRTLLRRPDLLEKKNLSEEEKQLLQEIKAEIDNYPEKDSGDIDGS